MLKKNFLLNFIYKKLLFIIFFIITLIIITLVCFKAKKYSENNFVVKEIQISGTSSKVKVEILNLLKDLIELPIEEVDLNKVKNIVMQITRIDKVSVSKNFPNVISLSVIEKNPVFIWQNNKDEFYLVGSDNAIIRKAKLEEYKKLILIKGYYLPIEKSEEVRFYIFGNQYLLKNVVFLEYNGYRWDVLLRNGIVIKLPENNIDNAIKLVMAMHNKYQILERKIEYIDARIPRKLFIKPEKKRVK